MFTIFRCLLLFAKISVYKHKPLCEAIYKLEKDEQEKIELTGQYQARLTPKEQSTLINLIERKSVMKCGHEGKDHHVL